MRKKIIFASIASSLVVAIAASLGGYEHMRRLYTKESNDRRAYDVGYDYGSNAGDAYSYDTATDRN